VRTTINIPILCISAASMIFCAEPPLRAETKPGGDGASTVAVADSTREVSVVVGMSVLIDTTKPIERVAVGLGDYAEATAITPTEILVNGKTAGETTMIIWEKRRHAAVHQPRCAPCHGVDKRSPGQRPR